MDTSKDNSGVIVLQNHWLRVSTHGNYRSLMRGQSTIPQGSWGTERGSDALGSGDREASFEGSQAS